MTNKKYITKSLLFLMTSWKKHVYINHIQMTWQRSLLFLDPVYCENVESKTKV